MTNIEAAASEPVKVQPAAEKSIEDKIWMEDKAKALQVYFDLSAYTLLTVGKQGQLMQGGTIIKNSNLVNLIAHDTKKKKGRKNFSLHENIFYCKETSSAKNGQLSLSHERSKVKGDEDYGGLL